MGLMGKSKDKTLAKRMTDSVKSPAPMDAPTAFKEPKRMPTLTVKQAHNGGFIVSMQGPGGYGSEKEHTYPKLSGVLSCMKDHFHLDAEPKEAAEGE
jgi:hypothetical protein